jgi:hypothetical protein
VNVPFPVLPVSGKRLVSEPAKPSKGSARPSGGASAGSAGALPRHSPDTAGEYRPLWIRPGSTLNPSAFLCLDCGIGLEEGVLLCPGCHERRREPGRLLQFDPERQRRTGASLASSRCSTCGWSWWGVPASGDAWCLACLELVAGRAPRCGRCHGTAWKTAADGRRSCLCDQRSDAGDSQPDETPEALR